jgi:hypothetical protein
MLNSILKYNSIALLTFFFIGLQLNMSAQEKREKHYSEKGKFEVKLPGHVEEDIIEAENSTTYKFHLKGQKTEYLATSVLHTINLDIDSLDLQQVSLESFAESIKGTVTKQSAWKVGKHTGIKAVIESNILYIEYGILIFGNFQYQIVAYAPPGEFDAKSVAKYFKSFKVK